MNILRWQAATLLRRIPCRPLAYSSFRLSSTSARFIPPAQFNDIDQTPRHQKRDGEFEEKESSDFNPRNKPIPKSPSFYTGRATYHDALIVLQNAVNTIHATLRNLQLLPLPDFARDSLDLHPAIWKPIEEMAEKLECKLTTTRYQKITALLNQLNHYLAVAKTAGYKDLAVRVNDILSEFESGKASLNRNRGKRAPVELDQYGRSYTVGKRKTSAARVWMIPVRVPSVDAPTTIPAPPLATTEIPSSSDESAAALTMEVPKEPITVTASTILVNNLPISEYFRHPHDRERILRPFRVAGVVGKYNVFIIVRGGGTTGQSGAIAHGIAKGIFAHEPESGTVLRRAKLLRRDPRMVERKKTGLAKSRKRYTWVKR
ncbi:30s ribosomal protein s9 [Moniliophthora roreri MCA 2997]|uniref:30s ribosomal protein s9 n=1 Tax=Moniliophthora roreri (strain MCA 2997) TaxID=1381753 RepID=V2XS31_MONRO|nr:30s ribosomal protein s9 [Moniliophthora roreri MCA 2997]